VTQQLTIGTEPDRRTGLALAPDEVRALDIDYREVEEAPRTPRWVRALADLGGRERELVLLLASRPGRLWTYFDLESRLWSAHDISNPRRSLQTLVSRVRRRIEGDPRSPRYLITDLYRGYRFYPDGYTPADA
jgi:DNA-binding response OmpR family regulator